MAGIIETVAIGGAAWAGVEAYRAENVKKRKQGLLIQELFAKYFGKDFNQVAPDRTTTVTTVKAGTDPDVAASYHFLSDFQTKRTRSLMQDLFSKEEPRGI